MNAEWRWDFAIEILPNMLWATLNTILAAGIGYAIAAVVGLLFLLGQRTPIKIVNMINSCLLYTSPSPRDRTRSRMPSSA